MRGVLLNLPLEFSRSNLHAIHMEGDLNIFNTSPKSSDWMLQDEKAQMELQTTRMISASRLAQDQPLFTVVRQPFLQECEILTLPGSIQERIFKFLTYEEISLMRSVCQKLAVLANYMLHTAFQRVGNTIEGRLHHIKTKTSAGKKMNDKHLSKCHALYVTAVEYRFVRAVCLRYLRLLSRCFFPGRLLDYFYRIVRITTEDQAKERSPRFSFILMDIVDELTFLVERFIRHFESDLETNLWGNNSTQVGVKIVDLLDCCLGSTCLLTVHYSRAACRLTGRYLCPLTGYFTCLRDLDQAESYTTGESDLGAWLSDLRELIRKSNQLYIEDLMKELRSENPQAPSRRYELPLFAGRRKSLSRNLSQDGLTCRETVERVLEPGTGPSFGYTSLAIQVRAQFPMWQWPLDLEPLGSLLNHLQITEDDDPEEKTAEYLEDLVHLGYDVLFPKAGPLPTEEIPLLPDRTNFLFYCEVHKSPGPPRRLTTSPERKDTAGNTLVFKPSRFSQLDRPNKSRLMVDFREVRMTPSDDGDLNIKVIIGQLENSPGQPIRCPGKLTAVGRPSVIKSLEMD